VPGECLNRFRCKALVFMDIEQVNEGWVHELNGNAETRSVEVGPREFRQIVFRWGIQDVSRSFEGPVFGEGEEGGGIASQRPVALGCSLICLRNPWTMSWGSSEGDLTLEGESAGVKHVGK